MAEKKIPRDRTRQKDLIIRALTDPKFREVLAKNPREALHVERISPELQKEIIMLLASVRGIESHISILADQILCLGGANCDLT